MMGFFGVYVCALLFVFFIYKLKKKTTSVVKQASPMNEPNLQMLKGKGNRQKTPWKGK